MNWEIAAPVTENPRPNHTNRVLIIFFSLFFFFFPFFLCFAFPLLLFFQITEWERLKKTINLMGLSAVYCLQPNEAHSNFSFFLFLETRPILIFNTSLLFWFFKSFSLFRFLFSFLFLTSLSKIWEIISTNETIPHMQMCDSVF